MKVQFLLLAMTLALTTPPGHAATVSGGASKPASVTVSQGVLTIPTYEQVGRYMEPPLFPDSTLTGLYPFTTYERAFKPGSPTPRNYPAVFIENEYLKLTYIPELGGRFFALYDKLHHREVFYRNDVIKPTQFNPRFSWPQSGIELTGPYDAHTLTLHSEPYWSHTIIRNKDGSVSVMLGEMDPIYHMNVTYTATLYPGVDALKISTFCYNGNDGQKPQMLWSNAAFRVTPKLRFLYPMTQTVGHTTGVVSPWPMYNGVDLSWAHNNMHMLGVFGIDSYDNYGGSYEFDHNYGVFRYADRRVVQGMKMWTFGFGPGSSEVEHSYTDKAGPYFEAQSGRMVWDGHYEWVYPHKTEQWHEWWIPVAGIGGLTTLTDDVALHLEVKPDPAGKDSSVEVSLSPVRTFHDARLTVRAKSGVLLQTAVNLTPGTPIEKTVDGIHADAAGLEEMEVTIAAGDGKVLLQYRRPDGNPGGDVTPFAKGLLEAPIPPEKMTAEQLVLAAEFKQKDLNSAEAEKLANLALKQDPGYSTAHQLLGVLQFDRRNFELAAKEFQKAVDRNPYADESWYYLAICQLHLGERKQAERNFYYIWPASSYYGPREYQLGRINFLRHDDKAAAQHLLGAINSNGEDLDARLLLALVYRDQSKRDQGKKEAALEQLAKVSAIDPPNRVAQAERFFLTGDRTAESALRSLMGEQSEDAIQVSIFYSSLSRWEEAATVLQMVEPPHNKDPWGTPPVYYYTLAYMQKQAGDLKAAAENRKKAQAAAGIVERFPYRPETVAPLEDAVKEDPNDAVARFNLACLLYFLDRRTEAIQQWEAVNRIDPSDFSSWRALGLAYEAEGKLDQAISALQKAVDLKPDNDHLVEGVLKANLIQGKFQAAQDIVDHHTFRPVHRTYALRNEYRALQYGMGAQAFNKGDYEQALKLFQAALTPPASLGMDDFEQQATPLIHYYIGRTLDAMGRKADAVKAYEESIRGADQLTGGGSESWSPENFFMVFSLERLGRNQEAADLVKNFQLVANSRADSENPLRSARASYLNGLIALYRGQPEEAKKRMAEAVEIEPDYIAPRYELRGDTINPIGAKSNHP